MKSINPLENFLNEDGTIRRRDNVVVVLAEGDILIDADGEPYVVEDGELTIHTSGTRTGDGTLALIEREQAAIAVAGGRSIFNVEELGLNE